MNTHALRLIDANANRAREALRVMEDAARFVLNDPAISERAKQMRHDLAEALRPVDGLALHRDTPRDVGASLATTAESRRDRIDDVAIAAGKRLSEALRCIEEYAKTSGHDRDVAPRIEKLRYRGYELETLLNRRLAMPDPRTWRVCVIITESLCTRHGWLDVARAALEGGAQCIQLREKELESAALHDRAARLLELIRDQTSDALAHAALIINDRVDIALAAGADGVHLGQHDLSPDAARRVAGRSLLIGASTHNRTEATQAVRNGVDYCGVGAIYATTTKRRPPSGVAYLKEFLRDYPDTPHLAIGGIGPANIDEVIDAGARGVAVSACVCGAKRPGRVVRQLLTALGPS